MRLPVLISLVSALSIGLTVVRAEDGAGAKGSDKPAKSESPASEVRKILDKNKGHDDSTQPKIWIQPGYTLMWSKSPKSRNDLVTTNSSPNITAGLNEGAKGTPGTRQLFAKGRKFKFNPRHGGQLTVGAWLTNDKKLGVEASGFMMAPAHARKTFTSDGSTLLAAPFVNTGPGFGFVGNQSMAFAGTSTTGLVPGSISIKSSTRTWGTDAAALFNLKRNAKMEVNLLAGVKYFDLEDKVSINRRSRYPAGYTLNFNNSGFTSAMDVRVEDKYRTHNQFYGAMIGSKATFKFNRVSLGLGGKLGLGVNRQTSELRGLTQARNGAGTFFSSPYGLYVLPTNRGTFTQNKFAVAPEFNVDVNVRIVSNFSLNVGYKLMYMSNVVRASDQIDTHINRALVPFDPTASGSTDPNSTPRNPGHSFKTTDYWAHGLTVGFKLVF